MTGSADLLPLAVGLFRFNGLYSSEPMIILLTIFFLARRFFMQSVVPTGDK